MHTSQVHRPASCCVTLTLEGGEVSVMLKPQEQQERHIRTGVACFQFILRIAQFRQAAAIPCKLHKAIVAHWQQGTSDDRVC